MYRLTALPESIEVSGCHTDLCTHSCSYQCNKVCSGVCHYQTGCVTVGTSSNEFCSLCVVVGWSERNVSPGVSLVFIITWTGHSPTSVSPGNVLVKSLSVIFVMLHSLLWCLFPSASIIQVIVMIKCHVYGFITASFPFFPTRCSVMVLLFLASINLWAGKRGFWKFLPSGQHLPDSHVHPGALDVPATHHPVVLRQRLHHRVSLQCWGRAAALRLHRRLTMSCHEDPWHRVVP